jgi:hypothetical protein
MLKLLKSFWTPDISCYIWHLNQITERFLTNHFAYRIKLVHQLNFLQFKRLNSKTYFAHASYADSQ